MKIPFLRALSLTVLGLGLCSSACERDDKSATPQTTSGRVPAADNTKVNQRDTPESTGVGAPPTPTDQSNDIIDLSVTQQIRKAIVSDDSLSIDAKNVKVITEHGIVTLRGPVKTAAERAAIASKARDLSQGNRVDDQLEVETTTPQTNPRMTR